jgi:hypothetical protein
VSKGILCVIAILAHWLEVREEEDRSIRNAVGLGSDEKKTFFLAETEQVFH